MHQTIEDFNPHACADPANPYHTPEPPSPPEWRTDPEEFLQHHKATPENTPDGFATGVTLALESMDGTVEDADSVIVLLCKLSEALPTYRRSTPETGADTFLEFGPLLVPASPLGLSVLRTLRAHAERMISGRSMGEIAGKGTPLAILARAFEDTGRSALVSGTRNSTHTSGNGFRFSVHIDSRAMTHMPNGTTLPQSILTPALVGTTVTDAHVLQNEMDACDSGTVDFLERFGIGFERADEYLECESCGTEHDSEESGSIESIDDFEITPEMAEYLERQGYSDAIQDYIGSEEGTDEWGRMLEASTDAEILERCAPSAEDGIRYNRDVWEFAPDFEGIDGIESLEWSEQARALPLVVRVAHEHASAGMLPPIGGTLTLKPIGYYPGNHSPEPSALSFAWDPEWGTLTHEVSATMALRIDARNGKVLLVLSHEGTSPIVTLSASGSDWDTHPGSKDAGEHAARLLSLFQGSARL